MVRYFTNADKYSGKLIIEKKSANSAEVFYLPSTSKLKEMDLESGVIEKYKTKILSINNVDDYVIIFPIRTLINPKNFLSPKYNNVTSITLEGFGYRVPSTTEDVMELLEELPQGFIKDYDYGLGLQKDYRFLIHAMESIGKVESVIVSKKTKTSLNEKAGVFTISFKDYSRIRKQLNRITSRAGTSAIKVKSVTTYNALADLIAAKPLSQQKLNIEDFFLSKSVQSNTRNLELKESDQGDILDIVENNKRPLIQNHAEKMMKLHGEIELVALEELVTKYEEMLNRNISEKYWQALFNLNPFILGMVFNCPIIKIRGAAFVGGKKVDGRGDKISDFLMKNSVTNNVALLEIKKPSSPLINKRPYRENVYSPTSEFVGAVNQLLDQQYHFQKGIAMFKENNKMYDIETYAAQGVLIIGRTPSDKDQQKSFELYRANSKQVTIVTFDELLCKLKQLQSLLNQQ